MKAVHDLQVFADQIREAQGETVVTDALVSQPPTRDQVRSARPREGRAITISIKEMTKEEIEFGRQIYPESDYWKPRVRAECADGERPCPYVSCSHHLYLDTSRKNGSIKFNFPDIEVWELGASCSLDVADAGGAKLEEVGAAMNLTRERVRQIEVKALAKIERSRSGKKLREMADDGIAPRRRLPVLEEHDEDEEADEEPAQEDPEDDE